MIQKEEMIEEEEEPDEDSLTSRSSTALLQASVYEPPFVEEKKWVTKGNSK